MANPDLTDKEWYLDPDRVLATVNKHLHAIKSQRTEKDWDDFKNEAYYRGKHFTVANDRTNRLTEAPARQGELRVPIHMARDFIQRTMRDITTHKPVWETVPDSTTDYAITEARAKNRFLDAVYERTRLDRKIKQVVKHGLKFSIGVAEVFWNKELPEGGDIDIRIVHPSDFYMGLQYEDPTEAPAIIKIIRKDIGYLLKSDIYSKLRNKWGNELMPDNKYTENQWRQFTMFRSFGPFAETQDVPVPQGTVLLAECYLKYYDGGIKPKYRLVTFPVNQPGILLRNEETDLDRPPFFLYRTDPETGELYSESLLKTLVPANKALDLLENKILSHHNKFIGGKYIAEIGADPDTVTNESGQIVYINPGRRFDELGVPPLPNTSRETAQAWHQYAQDTAGIHEISLGRAPSGVESARGLESLRQGDVDAKSDYVSQLELFLESVARYVFTLGSKYYTTTRLVTLIGDSGGLDQFKVVGDASPIRNKQKLGAVVLKPDTHVKVIIGSALGNTPEAKQQKVLELFQMGLIPREEVLKTFGYGNIADISQRALQQAMQAQEAQQEKPQPKDTRDYINTKLSDMTPDERAQYLQQINIKPTQDPSQIPGSVAAQLLMEHVKTSSKVDLANQSNLLGHRDQHQKMVTGLTQQAMASAMPAIPGGAAPHADMLNQLGQQAVQPPEEENNGGQSQPAQ